MVTRQLSARLRRTGRFPRPRSPGEEQRDRAEPAALAREADAEWALPGATVEDLNGPEERQQPGAWQTGRGASERCAVVRQFVRVGRSPPPSQLKKATEAVGIGLRRRPRYGCHSGESHC